MNRFLKIALLVVALVNVLLFGFLFIKNHPLISSNSPSITIENNISGYTLSWNNKKQLLVYANQFGIWQRGNINDFNKSDPLTAQTIILNFVDKPQGFGKVIDGRTKAEVRSYSLTVEPNLTIKLNLFVSNALLTESDGPKQISSVILSALYDISHRPPKMSAEERQKNIDVVSLQNYNLNQPFIKVSKKIGLHFTNPFNLQVYADYCNGNYACYKNENQCTCNDPGGSQCNSSGTNNCGPGGVYDCSCSTQKVNYGNFNCAGKSNLQTCNNPCSTYDGEDANNCNFVTSTPAPQPTSILTLTPQPTNPPSSCTNPASCTNSDQCCSPDECDTSTSPGKCKVLGPNPPCSFSKCNCRGPGCFCTAHGYGSDCARWPGGDCCGRPDTPECQGGVKTCVTPGPTQAPPPQCIISGDDSVIAPDTEDYVLTKYNGAARCNAPTYSGNCSAYPYGQFDQGECFDPTNTACAGTVQFSGSGQCIISASCDAGSVTCNLPITVKDPNQVFGYTVKKNKWDTDSQTCTDTSTCYIDTAEMSRTYCPSNTTTSGCQSEPPVNNTHFEGFNNLWPYRQQYQYVGIRVKATDSNGDPMYIADTQALTRLNGVHKGTCINCDNPSANYYYYVWLWNTINQGDQRVAFVFTTNPPTPTLSPSPTPSPTPVQTPWIKLKNTSFQTVNGINMSVPNPAQQYDNDDSGASKFILPEEGMVSAASSTIPAAQLSVKGWYDPTTPSIVQSKDSFLSYVKARKKYTVLNTLSSDLHEITNIANGDGIYYYKPNGLFTITTDYSGNTAKNIVLIIDGQVDFNVSGGMFNVDGTATEHANKSIAILANSIAFYNTSQNSNFMTNANGIFIADAMDTGESGDTGLKIVGNLITSDLNNARDQNGSNNALPSVFVVNDIKQYMTLIPYMSVSTYNWKQLQ